jgi:hypothetical protein
MIVFIHKEMNMDMKKVRLTTMFMLLAMSIGLCSCAKKVKQTEVKNPAELLGLSGSQLVERLGDPHRRGTSRPGLEELFYEDVRFGVYLENDVVAACNIGDGSSVKLSSGIGCGTPLVKVVEQYGPYDSEQEAGDLASDEYAPRILYHKVHTPDTERYNLHYPEKRLLFTFYPNKQVHSIWLGKIF